MSSENTMGEGPQCMLYTEQTVACWFAAELAEEMSEFLGAPTITHVEHD
jgi:hypothetical protein